MCSLSDDDCWKEDAHTQLCTGPSNVTESDRAERIMNKLKTKYGEYHALLVVVQKADSYHGHCWAHNGWKSYEVENACDNRYHMLVLTLRNSEQCHENIKENAKQLTSSVQSLRHDRNNDLCKIVFRRVTKYFLRSKPLNRSKLKMKRR